MSYIAHVRERDKSIQSVKAHLIGVQRLAETYGEKLGLRHVAGLAGILHDLGKYSDEFQTYIYDAVYRSDESERKRGEVDHSSAGGRLLYTLLHRTENSGYEKLLSEIVGNAIISHHSNLQDYISPESQSDYLRRVQDKELPGYDLAVKRFFQDTMTREELLAYIAHAVDELRLFTDRTPTQSFFLSKFIFSCLIDADRTDTRLFEDAIDVVNIDQGRYLSLFEDWYHRLIDHLATLREKGNAQERINMLRSQMSEQCDSFAAKPSGIYTLSIPTGGGKTLASLRYALKHAHTYNKQRIIYVVPYTTIIEQNAQEIRSILNEDEHVLEHHSNIIEDDADNYQNGDEMNDGIITKSERLKLARDNWDSPIIFTTLVQFLNVFYAKGNKNTRRMHNLSHAVVIFDEVQKVPIHCVSLFNEALNFLKKYAYCSILLCTATQPTLDKVKYSLLKDRDGEIVQNLEEVARSFKRVELVDQTEKPVNNAMLADWIRSEIHAWGSTLVILNTKKAVKNLYNLLMDESVPVYHLSTSMCAAHRKEQLDIIRELLQQQLPFICVTTQLIEAGVDVSFKCVIRSLAGLDSIAQAAGRCNRHGEDESRNVYVIDHSEEKLSSSLKEIEVGKGISANLFAVFKTKAHRYGGSLLYQQAMEEYFQYLYKLMESSHHYFIPALEIDMTKLLMSMNSENRYVAHYDKKNGKRFPLLLNGSYKTAAEHFHVIDESTTSVIVPYGEGRDIIAELNSSERVDDISRLLKRAQQYTVNLYPNEFNQLRANNAIVEHLDGMIYELKENWYNREFGVDRTGESGMEFMEW